MVSDHFIHDFKERNHISSRLAHPKRRSDSNEEQNIEWENDIGELLNTFPRDRILNCDETSWQIFPNSLKTWAETGSQNIQIQLLPMALNVLFSLLLKEKQKDVKRVNWAIQLIIFDHILKMVGQQRKHFKNIYTTFRIFIITSHFICF